MQAESSKPRLWTLDLVDTFRGECWVEGPEVSAKDPVRVVEAEAVIELLDRLVESPSNQEYKAAIAAAKALLGELRGL